MCVFVCKSKRFKTLVIVTASALIVSISNNSFVKVCECDFLLLLLQLSAINIVQSFIII